MTLPRDIRDGMSMQIVCVFIHPSEYDLEVLGVRTARELAQQAGKTALPPSQTMTMWVRP